MKRSYSDVWCMFLNRPLIVHLGRQAILPLRGKILNIERKDDAAIYKNQEIQNLILALGLGVKVCIFDPFSANSRQRKAWIIHLL